MNWITNFVKPKLQSLIRKNDIPDNLWIKCLNCDHMIFHRVLEECFYVCNHCDYHFNIPSDKRFQALFDHGKYTYINVPAISSDPLKFKDLKKYSDRLKQYRKKSNVSEASSVAFGTIQQKQCVVFSMNFSFIGGSMGIYVGESFVKGVEYAIENNCAFIAITASGGARMQESVLSLMQMPRTVAAIELLKERKLPYICILTNPTMGGVTASFAMLGDISIAEPKALIGFTGPRVIEQTIREKLPEDFQKAEYLLEHGMIDSIVHRKNIPEYLGKVLNIL